MMPRSSLNVHDYRIIRQIGLSFPQKFHQQLESTFKPVSVSGRDRRHASRSRIKLAQGRYECKEDWTYRVLDLAGLVTHGVLCS